MCRVDRPSLPEITGDKSLMNDSFDIKTRVGVIVTLFFPGLFLALSLWIVFFPGRKDYDSMVRSSSLQQVTKEEGDITEITYVDENGAPTVAANAGYATVRRTKRADGVLEEYLDENGKRTINNSGYYALLREYDDQQRECKVTWLNEDGTTCLTTSGYAILNRTFDEGGRTEKELYCGMDGEPIETFYYAYGRRFTYDEQGRIIVITYIDQNGNATMTGQGFACIRRDFFTEEDVAWRVERDYFLDENGAPLASANGTYGRRFTYDELGRTETLTCLDQNGNPFVNSDGFAIVKYTYYNDDSIKTEMFYDTAGKPIAQAQGQYGVLHEGDQVTYLNEDGSQRFSFRNLLFNQPGIAMLAAVIAVVLSLAFGKRVNYVLLLITLCSIVIMTLMHRKVGENRAQLELFYYYRNFFSSYPDRKEIIDNIWLFVPLGTILFRLFPKRWIWLVPIGLSALIEAVQYVTGIGSAETDDVVSNGLGGLIGVAVAVLLEMWIRSRKKKGRIKQRARS